MGWNHILTYSENLNQVRMPPNALLIAQYKKGLAAFEGKKKDKKDFCFGGVWTHNIKGKRYFLRRPSQHGHGRFIRKDQMIDIKNLLLFVREQ